MPYHRRSTSLQLLTSTLTLSTCSYSSFRLLGTREIEKLIKDSVNVSKFIDTVAEKKVAQPVLNYCLFTLTGKQNTDIFIWW